MTQAMCAQDMVHAWQLIHAIATQHHTWAPHAIFQFALVLVQTIQTWFALAEVLAYNQTTAHALLII